MNSSDFVKAIRSEVRESSILGALELGEDPAGRKVLKEQLARAEWLKSLSEKEKTHLRSLIADGVDGALFGLFCVLDGVRKIGDSENTSFELWYRDQRRSVLLNRPDGAGLHEIYNDPELTKDQ